MTTDDEDSRQAIPTGLAIAHERLLGADVLTVMGDLDVYSSPGLAAVAQEESTRQRLVLDLRQVDFFDSMALGVLITIRKNCLSRGVDPVLVVATNTMLSRTLRTADLGELFTIVNSREAALALSANPPGWSISEPTDG